MKNLKLIIPVVLLTAILLLACSTDKSNSPIAANQTDYSQYFPTTIGSWWIMENYTLDENLERVNLTSRDSMVVVGNEIKAGKTAAVFITYDIETGLPTDTSYYYMEGSKGYEYTTITPFSSEKKWILIQDFEASKAWSVLDTNVTNADMGNGSLFTGDIKADIKKGVDKTLEIKGQNYLTKVFDINMLISGDASANGSTFPIAITMVNSSFFAEGIGNVQNLTQATIEFAGQTTKDNSESIVVDYYIK